MADYLMWCLGNLCFYVGIGLCLYFGCCGLEWLEGQGYCQWLVEKQEVNE